jgi:hypothetical protein
MWGQPLAVVRRILHTVDVYATTAHGPGVFFQGRALPDPGPGYYPVALAFLLTPAASVGLVAAAVALIHRRSKTVGMMLVYAAGFGLMLAWGVKKQSRYLLPALLAVDVIAAWGWGAMVHWLTVRGARRLSVVGLVGLLIVQAATLLPHRPIYLTCYNPLLGGLRGAVHWIDVGWGESLAAAAAYLNSYPDAPEAQVVTKLTSAFAPYYVGVTVPYATGELNPIPPDTDYVVRTIAEQQRGLAVSELPADAVLQTVLRMRGVETVWIYRLNP